MYTVTDAVEMGKAHELILNLIKQELVVDDNEPFTNPAEEYFDE